MINISIVCGILIIMDIVCGTVAALRNRELCSTIAREGMYNKIGEAMFLLIAIIANEILGIPPFDTLGISPNVACLVAGYIAWTELVSILENICKINPDLPFAKILMIFNIDVDSKEEDTVELETAPEK
jgi:toxin secretion/phage lysis holin|nr:MAG TPA_asm: holin [Caudoviricetes sp.]